MFERVLVRRWRDAIPLRIAVTGTRGKSTVTRLLASVLRESGRATFAKTTGSEPVIIDSEGSEHRVRRRGKPSIMEQKHLLRTAAAGHADVAVVEIMSIHAENHFVEAQQLLQPHVVLVTNFRPDHTGAVGDTSDDVAAVLALDVPHGARVLVPRSVRSAAFREHLIHRAAAVEEVSFSSALVPEDRQGHFRENQDLVRAAARSLGIPDDVIARGIAQARDDIGGFAMWRCAEPSSPAPYVAVNAFAANDPESTLLLHDRVAHTLGSTGKRCVGLLSLRADRGDRTLQWADALTGDAADRFERLYLAGMHARALARRLRRRGYDAPIEVLRTKSPSRVMQTIMSQHDGAGLVVFGFGNIAGLGKSLIGHWMANEC